MKRISILLAVTLLSGCEASYRLNSVRVDPYPVSSGLYRVTVDDSPMMPFNEEDDFPRWIDYEVKNKGICVNGAYIIDRRYETISYTFESRMRIHYYVSCKE